MCLSDIATMVNAIACTVHFYNPRVTTNKNYCDLHENGFYHDTEKMDYHPFDGGMCI